ncbi:MAG: hypothetical protein OXU20_31245, partial [Myxococcales bacterium]|nr:hypothetical protein [Myxococcales bacterium]
LMDRHGEVVRDFGPLVELGDPYQAVRLSADGRVLELVEPSIGGGPVWFSDRPGAEPHYWKGLRTSRPLVLRAAHKTMDATRFRVLSIQGEMLADFEVPGTWDEPEISPRSGYLAARGELILGTPLWAVVLDITQGAIVWRGIVSRPLFSHDDRYFLYNVPNVGPIVGHNVLVDLPSGRERRLNPPPSMSNHPAVPTPEPLVMYYTTDAGMFGTAGFPTAAWIWFVPWGGQHVPFDPSLPNTARDRLGGVSEDGLVHWSRGSDDRDMPIASEGAYAFDPATGESQRRDTQCYVPAGQTRWTMRDNSLLACELGQPYREVLELPQLDEQWRYSVRGRSEEGDRVLIEIRWGGSELKYDYPGMATFVYDNSGRLLLEAPFGYATLDKTGTLLVHNTPRTREVNLIDVDSGTLTPLGPGTLGQILYEPASP